MSLRIWLPLNGSLENQGLDNVTVTNNGASVDNNGKIGKCYSFETSSYLKVSLPKISEYSTSTFSMCLWVKLPDPTSGNKQLLQIGKGSGWVNNRFTILYRGSTTASQVVTSISNGSSYCAYNCYADIPINTWVHIASVFDNRKLKLYIDGELKTTYNTTYDLSFASIEALGIGGAPNGAELLKSGYINDVRLYDNALSPQEVKKISQGLILHYPLNRRGFGQKNLHKNSDTITSNWTIEKGSCSNGITTLTPTSSGDCRIYQMPANGDWTWTIGKVYTASIDAKSSNGGILNFYPYGGADVEKEYELTSEWKRYNFTFTATKNATGSMSYRANNIVGTSLQLRYPKLEEGSIPTPWCPNSSDVLADTLELNGNILYDASGYKRNGQQFNLTYDSDTPKYNVSTVFTSANHSLIKILRNTFVIQGSEAMTWSVWAYMEDWSTYNARIYSCTESGGVNIQLSSNNLTWSIRAYTNEEKTTSSYISSLYTSIARTAISSGWHLFTWTYTTEGTKLYIDGLLHMLKEGVSYGIFFNATAPLIIGAEATGSNYSSPYFEGKMSDFRIYATALSAEDVLSLYQNEAIIESDGTIRGKIR